MRVRLEKFSYRFAEQVLNSKLNIKQEIEEILTDPQINLSKLSRPYFNKILNDSFNSKSWEGSLNFEKVKSYLPHFKSAIQVPIYVVGIDL